MTKINPENTGTKQTQGPAGCREAKTLRHPSVSPALTSPDVLSSFSLPCKQLPATVTSPSNTPASYEGRRSALLGARVLSRILARGRARLGGGRGAERLLGPRCSRRGRPQPQPRGPERGVSDRGQGHRLQWWFHRDPDPAEERRKPGWGTAGGGPSLLQALPTVRAALPSRARPGCSPRIQLDWEEVLF